MHRATLRTDAGTITGEGPDLVARVSDGALSVLLLAGRVEIRNLSGVVTVDRARHGIERIEASHEPGHAYGWPRQRVDRTLAELAMP